MLEHVLFAGFPYKGGVEIFAVSDSRERLKNHASIMDGVKLIWKTYGECEIADRANGGYFEIQTVPRI